MFQNYTVKSFQLDKREDRGSMTIVDVQACKTEAPSLSDTDDANVHLLSDLRRDYTHYSRGRFH